MRHQAKWLKLDYKWNKKAEPGTPYDLIELSLGNSNTNMRHINSNCINQCLSTKQYACKHKVSMSLVNAHYVTPFSPIKAVVFLYHGHSC